METKYFRTIAESISISSDPHEAAIRSFARREHNRYANEKIYHFEDGSYLVFKVSYAVQRSGVSS